MRRENKSWTRIEYEIACRHYRFTGEPDKGALCTIQESIWRAADYSYQAATYYVHGWMSDARRKRFHAIKYRAFAFAEDIPL